MEALSIVATVAMAIGTGALVALHVLPTGYNPVRDAVSDYAIGRYRAAFWVFAAAGAVAGLAVAIALARSHPSKPTLAVAMLLLSAAARFLIPLFPTDQSGSRFQTLKGTVHMVLAVAIFASIAVAASSLGGPWDTNLPGMRSRGLPTAGSLGRSRELQSPRGSLSEARGCNGSLGSSSGLLPVVDHLVLRRIDRARTNRGLTTPCRHGRRIALGESHALRTTTGKRPPAGLRLVG